MNVGLSTKLASDATIGGERKHLGGKKMGDVSLAVDAAETIGALFAAELARAGHTVSPDQLTPGLDVVVETLAARTEARPFGPMTAGPSDRSSARSRP